MKEKTGIIAACVFAVLLLPFVILLLTPKGNGGMYAKIESKLSDAIVAFNRREHLELRVTTTGTEENLTKTRLWISGDNWLEESMVITKNGQKTITTLQYDGMLYRCEDGMVTCREETAECPFRSIDRLDNVFSAWERQWNGAFTTSGETEVAVAEQVNGICRRRVEYAVDWMKNLRQKKTIWMTENGSPKRIHVMDVLGWNKKLCTDQIEAAYAEMQAALNHET